MILYHVINDDDCAEIRRAIVQMNLVEDVTFRNIDRSESARNDLRALQGSELVPYFIYQGQGIAGKVAILEFLKTLTS